MPFWQKFYVVNLHHLDQWGNCMCFHQIETKNIGRQFKINLYTIVSNTYDDDTGEVMILTPYYY